MLGKNLVVLMAVMTAFLMVISIAMPFIVGDSGRSRMKAIRAKRESMRRQFESDLPKATSLRERLNKQTFSGKISDKLNLKRFFNMDRLKMKLMVAGWRDASTLPKFLVVHLIVPVVLGGFAGWALYNGPFKTSLSPSLRPLVVLAAAAIGLAMPNVMLTNAAQNRAKKLTRQFPDALDLMLVCVEAGLAVENALLRVTEEMGDTVPEVAEEFALTGAELALLGDRSVAYKNLVSRTTMSEEFKHLSTAMAQSEQYGTAMADALRMLSKEAREMRVLRVEKIAAGLGPKMTVPMILFILPCMFLIIIGPTIVNIMGAPKVSKD